jgi:hypothetical protein
MNQAATRQIYFSPNGIYPIIKASLSITFIEEKNKKRLPNEAFSMNIYSMIFRQIVIVPFVPRNDPEQFPLSFRFGETVEGGCRFIPLPSVGRKFIKQENDAEYGNGDNHT